MHNGNQRHIFGYLVALLAVGGALLARFLLDPLLGDHLPFVTFFVAVVVASWYGGMRPGLLSTVLGFILSWYFFVPPRYGFVGVSGPHLVGLAMYFMVSLAIAGFGGIMREAERRSAQDQQIADEQRKRAATLSDDLRKRVEELDALVRILPVGIFVAHDPTCTNITMNPAGAEMLGIDPNTNSSKTGPDADGLPFRVLRDGVEVPGEELPIQRAARTGETVQAEVLDVERADGTMRSLYEYAIPLFDQAEKLRGCLGVFVDITDRKNAEAALRRSEQELSDFFENASVGLHWVGPEGTILRVNQAELDLLGYTREEYVGQHIAEFHVDRPVIDDILRRLEAGERLYDHPARMRCKDGSIKDVLIDSSVMWEEGRFVHTRCFTRDVTDRKRAETALRESEQRFKTLTSHAPVGIFQTDAEGNYLFVNERWSEMTGLPLEQARGQGWVSAVHPEDRDRVRREWYEVAKAGREFASEYRFQRPDGQATWLSGSAIALCQDNGEVRGYIGTVTDITQRKHAEETIRSLLRISKRLNSTLEVDSLLDILVQEAIVLVGAESGVSGLRTPEGMVAKRYFQNGKVLPLEYCWPPMHGLPGWLLVHKVPYLTNNALQDSQIVHELCLQFGVRSALSTPVITADGDVVGFFEIHNKQDSSGFTSADQELLLAVSQAAAIAVQNALAYRTIRRAQESLQESDRRKDEFLATLAHELRNPLAPIRNGLELLRIAGDDESMADEARAMMERQLQQMVRLVDDLLDVSRISRGKLQLQKGNVELVEVLKSAIETCQPAIEAAGHELEVLLPEEPVYLDADATRLAQAFYNLLNNACKYTERGGRIRLAAERQGSDVVVSVQDNGVGIPPAMLDQVFEMFTQVDRSLERSHGGLGIGLTIVKRLVEMHGGNVLARSAGAGRGTEFIVRLPVALSVVREAIPDVMDGLLARITRRRILVADDNQDSANTLAMLLRVRGNDVRTAHDGQEAVELAGSYRPDVVLMDIGMPQLSGYDAARQIRQQPWGKGMVLIALTGWGQEEDKRRSQAAGFDHHLVKPVEPMTLEKVLKSLEAATA